MRPSDAKLGEKLNARLLSFSDRERKLPGVKQASHRHVLVEQLIESIRRVKYVAALKKRGVSPLRSDPSSDLFDPLRAAVLHTHAGNVEEAFWLVFLFIHFGKHAKTGWRLIRNVYGALGDKTWSWKAVSANPKDFCVWIEKNAEALRKAGGGFGNHRKYESIRPSARRGIGKVVKSYVTWVAPPRTHRDLFEKALAHCHGDRKKTFEYLYDSMDVLSFGRTARFDYLAMIGKLGLANVEPGIPHIRGSSGPDKGARLLFGGKTTAAADADDLEQWSTQLGDYLGVGMQVVEDALCNWQKSPSKFKPFRG